MKALLYSFIIFILLLSCDQGLDFSRYEKKEPDNRKTILQMIINNLNNNREPTLPTPAVTSELEFWFPEKTNGLPGKMFSVINPDEACPDTYTVAWEPMHEGCKYVQRFGVHYDLNMFQTRSYYYYLDTVYVTSYIDTVRYVYPQDTIHATRVEVVERGYGI